MEAIETFAIVDEEGSIKIGNLPGLKNKKVKVLILIEENNETGFHTLSLSGLADAYSADEPDYQLNSISKPNDSYAGR